MVASSRRGEHRVLRLIARGLDIARWDVTVGGERWRV